MEAFAVTKKIQSGASIPRFEAEIDGREAILDARFEILGKWVTSLTREKLTRGRKL